MEGTRRLGWRAYKGKGDDRVDLGSFAIATRTPIGDAMARCETDYAQRQRLL
jgi:hypothetical protein